ncbi:MAG: T9SS type A sorting domain-containing protein [Bacteroidetes bacterium]|nr:T9SS type A sorting domain-containing protein [Bacteroidota bacterium]
MPFSAQVNVPIPDSIDWTTALMDLNADFFEIKEGGLAFFEQNPSHQADLESLASNTDRAGVLTQGLLNAYSGMIYWPPIELPGGGGSPFMAIPNKPAEEESSKAIGEEASGGGSLFVIPNPVQDEMEIRFNLSDEAGKATLSIVNMQGRLIKEWQVTSTMTSTAYDTSHLLNGLYLVHLRQADGKSQTTRFIIAK